MGKSAKAYRVERDTALAELDLFSVEALAEVLKTSQIDEETLEQLKQKSTHNLNSTIFKATDVLIKQNRLIRAELSSNTFKLEFRI